MRSEAYISVAKTDVRLGQLTRHAARRYEAGRAFAIASGLGLPKTWSLSTSAALDGFEKGLIDSKGKPPADRLRIAVGAARDMIADRCDQLVERVLPDASIVAMVLGDGELHVMAVGSGRVYIQRAGQPQRLTAREEERGGLLRARPVVSQTPLEPGDLVLAGSVTAFSMSAVAKAMSVLSADPGTQPAVLASLLTEPANKAGVGAAAVVFRVS